MEGKDKQPGLGMIQEAPRRWLTILGMLGPAYIWAAEYIGSGEVILSTRLGALFGFSIVWIAVWAIVLKAFIGYGGACYTTFTGEGMIDMIGRIPPGKWGVWLVGIAELAAGAISIGALITACSVFTNALLPFLSPVLWGWILSAIIIYLIWSGSVDRLKVIQTVMVVIMVLGVLYTGYRLIPSFGSLISGLFVMQIPQVPAWAAEKYKVTNPLRELVPILGWAGGGFASQCWYTYWTLGAGYGMARLGRQGKAADETLLKEMSVEDANRVKGWLRMVRADTLVASLIGVVVIIGFVSSGAGVLHVKQILPAVLSVLSVLPPQCPQPCQATRMHEIQSLSTAEQANKPPHRAINRRAKRHKALHAKQRVIEVALACAIGKPAVSIYAAPKKIHHACRRGTKRLVRPARGLEHMA